MPKQLKRVNLAIDKPITPIPPRGISALDQIFEFQSLLAHRGAPTRSTIRLEPTSVGHRPTPPRRSHLDNERTGFILNNWAQNTSTEMARRSNFIESTASNLDSKPENEK